MPSDVRQRVLVVTGSMLTAHETSLRKALVRQLDSARASSGAWLDLEIKLGMARRILGQRWFRRGRRFARAQYAGTVSRYFAAHASQTRMGAGGFGDRGTDEPPELTEVVLATLLRDQGMPFEVATYAELHADDARRERLLARCSCVFASTTLLRDMSELAPMITMLARPGNRIVAGGALAGILHSRWSGCRGVDVLAVGYGERLVAALCAWIRSGYTVLEPPEGGRVVHANGTTVLYSGLPVGTSLDDLPSPDWTLAEAVHGRRFRHVNYESVRGCPYRCAFCNYPYLFDDTKFRYRSAARIADDWQRLADRGVEHITCLDSLFTMPKRRLVELCGLLVARDIRVRWTCYARAGDLADLETCRMMHAAGCRQVQIGFESGSQRMLDNMDKRSTVAENVVALANCRAVKLTTLVTVIVGFPGETDATVRESFEVLRAAPPDVYYIAPFNTRVEHVPIMRPEARARFGLRTHSGGSSGAPYWTHDTMSCADVVDRVEWLHRRLVDERVALDGTIFYEGLLHYDPADREALLDFQRDVQCHMPMTDAAFRAIGRWVNRKLRKDVARVLAPESDRPEGTGRIPCAQPR